MAARLSDLNTSDFACHKNLNQLSRDLDDFLASETWGRYASVQQDLQSKMRWVHHIPPEVRTAMKEQGWNVDLHVGTETQWAAIGRCIKEDQRDKGFTHTIGTWTECYYSFDQTEGDALPTLPDMPIQGDHSDLLKTLLAVAARNNRTVEMVKMAAGFRGKTLPDRSIQINRARPIGNQCKTLLHELTHSLFHSWPRPRHPLVRVNDECEAEGTAYCCARLLDLPALDSAMFLANQGATGARLLQQQDYICEYVTQLMHEIIRVESA